MPQARPTLPQPILMLVTDSLRFPDGTLDDVVRDAVLGGVNIVQLREKHLERGELIEIGLRVREAIAGRALFFVNGDVEAARTLHADGVHLPSYGATVRDVRLRLGDQIIVSLAVHSAERALTAQQEGADLCVLGTAFETKSKPGKEPLGLAGLRNICEAVTIPVVAIGGITSANAPDVMRAGAAGIAVMGAILDAPLAGAAAADLRAAISSTVRA